MIEKNEYLLYDDEDEEETKKLEEKKAYKLQKQASRANTDLGNYSV